MGSEIPAEMEFITSAVRPQPDVDRMETLTSRDLDWNQVVQRAVKRHKVGPLLYRNLIESGSDELVPERISKRLRRQSKRTGIRNLSLTNSLVSILKQFDERGIRALPYKGPALSERIYADFSLRQARDIDILVRPEDLLDAEDVLLERGFEPRRELTEEQKRLVSKYGRHRTMKKEGAIVELHPRISRFDPPFEVSSLLDRAGFVTLDGESIPAIRPIDTLLILSVHGTRHLWHQLKWICDIAYLIQNQRFDWTTVLEAAKRRNCYRRVVLGCRLATTILGVKLPDVVHSKFHDIQPLIRNTYPACLLRSDGTTSLRYRLRCRDDTTDRIRYCWNKLTIPPARETGEMVLPERLSGLQSVIYPIWAITSKLRTTTRSLRSKLSTNTKMR